MRVKFFRRVASNNEYYSALKEAHRAQKPGLISGALSGYSWRYKSMGKTIEVITNLEEQKKLQQHATDNLKRWAKTKSSAPLKVEVVPKDWGSATFEATKEHGEPYSVLNMANSLYPGGSVLGGGNAQEENMWHRTTCALSLMDKWIEFDKTTYSFLYTEEGRKLVEARKKMTEVEITILKERCPGVFSSDELYKTLFSKKPRVCFRGEELYFDPSSADEYLSRGYEPNPDLSYLFLPASSIFPFYELRSAAPEHFSESQSQEPKVLKAYEDNLRRRIAAQLDTLILEERPYAIFGAWGCGAFKNDPERVAKIYAEEIEKRASFFQHILFPIIDTKSNSQNFDIFSGVLTGIALGESSAPRNTNKV
ncbi:MULTISPECIES: poly(ADP-ribose) glycohydrolase domain-containing protein [Legionella]|uniref:DUF2263 domain-containing protein n=1 Tax=Legionella resiliens TaxID=2905958 RepID=A0ABS8X2U7_9GAMM|nr:MULTISPECIES: poly(ADP-ribose) glycohydrolase domain-containing protein [unclassified Legionella]MCE0723023.1 DUF2263 domain-containing protein [Legionella sp. 9fVS26]MCE3532176.1 DUF2263 domain-containing protein [Legionella sp. 8cVS16]QLZ68302.1 TIGR02452 family protein [Legionella sp. PC1000]